MVNNTYTGYSRVKKANVTPVKVPVLNNDIKLHYIKDSLNVITHILDEKCILDLTLKASFDPRILCLAI